MLQDNGMHGSEGPRNRHLRTSLQLNSAMYLGSCYIILMLSARIGTVLARGGELVGSEG